MVWKLIKKGSKAKYGGKRIVIKEILLNKTLICPIGKDKKNCKVVLVSKLKDITPKPK